MIKDKITVASKFDLNQQEKNLITISRMKSASCPFKYFKEYVEKPKPTPEFESIEIGMGQYFHSYIEDQLNKIKAERRLITKKDIINIDELLRNFRLSFIWEGKLRKPYRIVQSYRDIDFFIIRLESIAKNFNAFLKKKLIGHTVLNCEGELEIVYYDYHIRGKYDLITKTNNDLLILWDWKTGQAPKPAYYKDYKNQKIQLGIYALWMHYMYNTKNVKGSAIFLRNDYEELSETFTEQIEKDVINSAIDWRKNQNEVHDFPPIINNLCPWCGWKFNCPAHSENETGYPSYEVVRSAKRKSKCFIATCIYGNQNCRELQKLKYFRDNYLNNNIMGRLIIKCYESIAPLIVEVIKDNSIVKRVIKYILDYFVRNINKY